MLCAAFRTEPTTLMGHAYWLGLEDLDIGALAIAARRALREAEFMPTVAKLRELAGALKPGQLPPPSYHDMAATETYLERQETCAFHREVPDRPSAELVPWCRKCKRFGARHRLASNSEPEAISAALGATLDRLGRREP